MGATSKVFRVVMMLGSSAVAAPIKDTSSAVSMPSKRSRAKPLTKIDGRTVAARRIAELRSLFGGALTTAGIEIGPTLRLRIEAAAQPLRSLRQCRVFVDAGTWSSTKRGSPARGQPTSMSLLLVIAPTPLD